ncbi:Hypothetical protein GL50581_1482 [Giardia duodenalis ATCC 50581]|uniref:Trafficking protein particle complex subunit n=2 Tax=Giardia intestinalis TaxID=5741 RepID=C6LRU9_GIAIB|nr:Hypothetical protein GL50581_1482 [Giardia intestinalis ATCC 50581]
MIFMLLNSVLTRTIEVHSSKGYEHISRLQQLAFNLGFRAGSAYIKTLPPQQLSNSTLQVSFVGFIWEALFGPGTKRFLGKPAVKSIEIIFDSAELPLASYDLVVEKDNLAAFYCAFIEGCISGAIDSLGLLGNVVITQVDGLKVMLSVSIATE